MTVPTELARKRKGAVMATEQSLIDEREFYSGPKEKYEIVPERTAVILIGAKARHFDPDDPMYSPLVVGLAPQLIRVLGAARSSGMKVVQVVSGLRGDGSDIGRLKEIRPGLSTNDRMFNEKYGLEVYEGFSGPDDIRITKRRYSAFFATDLDLVLRSCEIDTVIIAGVVSNGCCEDTARDAFKLNYKVVFLSDGTASFGIPDKGWGEVTPEEAQRVTLSFVASSLGRVASIDEVISEVERREAAA